MVLVRAVFFLLAMAVNLGAQPLSKGFEYFYSLDYDESVAEFERAVAANPEDPEAYNHLAQALLYREMFHAGALESELVTGNNPFLRRQKMEPRAENIKRFDEAIAKAMSLAQARVSQNPRDAKANYALGVAYGFRANAGFVIRKAYMDALRDATQSRKLCNLVTEIEPGNVDAKLVQGLHDYVVGSLPFYMKFVGFLAGFRGDKEKGIATVKMVSEKGTLNKLDAQILLGVIYRRERRAADAIPLLRPMIARFPRNYLFRLELAQMYSDLGDKAKALETFDEIERLKKAGTKGYERLSGERLAFARGNMLFWYQDFDAAIEQLKLATAHPESLDLNNATMAWMRLGQCYDMKKQRAAAKPAYRAAIQMAPASEVAKESRRYLDAPYVRRD